MEDQNLTNFQNILRRAKTFTTLIFYNKKYINPYLLAAYGFQNSINTKCEYCRTSINLDPLFGTQFVEVKDPFSEVIRNHHSQCKIIKETDNFKNNPYQLNTTTVCQQGPKVYAKILQSYCRRNNYNFDFNVIEIFAQQPQNIKRYLKILTQKSMKQKKIGQTILSVLGWKLILQNDDSDQQRQDNGEEQKILQCQYCNGAGKFNDSEFHPIESHDSTCILIREQMWKVILRKLTVYSLENIDGEFLKTKGLIRAKQLRNQLHEILNKFAKKMQQSAIQLQTLKAQTIQRPSFINREQNAGAQQTQKREHKNIFDNISNISKQIESSFRNSIKRVKID